MSLFEYTAASDLLRDKIILVTGAGGGIGRAAAMAFGQHGAEVILSGRTASKLEETYDLMLASGCRTPCIYAFDLASDDEEAYFRFANELSAEFSHLDGLLHNASLLGQIKPISQQSLATWKSVQQVNVDSAFMLTKAMLPLLQKAESASLVFTSSGVGRRGRAYWGAYAVSKFATEGLMQVLADELENTSNIRVNSINPGATNTTMRQTAYPGEVPESNPAPDDIMPLYLYLMGADSVADNGKAFDAQPKP